MTDVLPTPEEWPAANRRRVHLVDKLRDGSISDIERVELIWLNRVAYEYIERHAPRPTPQIKTE